MNTETLSEKALFTSRHIFLFLCLLQDLTWSEILKSTGIIVVIHYYYISGRGPTGSPKWIIRKRLCYILPRYVYKRKQISCLCNKIQEFSSNWKLNLFYLQFIWSYTKYDESHSDLNSVVSCEIKNGGDIFET